MYETVQKPGQARRVLGVLTGGMDPHRGRKGPSGSGGKNSSLPSDPAQTSMTQLRPGAQSREPAWWHGCEKVGGLVISAPFRPQQTRLGGRRAVEGKELGPG